MNFRALCLDFDGVIADTENHHVAAWQRTFRVMGWEVDESECLEAMRSDDLEFLAAWFKRREVNESNLRGWVRRKQDLTRDLLAGAPRLFPGVAELIKRVAAVHPVAVVTTTWRENVEAVLGSAGLLDRIAFVIAKEDVAASKPDPAPYRKAVKRLRLPADRVVAIEDTDTGITSAHRAGLWSVLVGRAPGLDAPGERFLALTDESGKPCHLSDTARVLSALGWSDLA